MRSSGAPRVVLMSAEFASTNSGFHRLRYKVDPGRGRNIRNVVVLISVDAYRKLANQLTRARIPVGDREQFLKHWARWEIETRYVDYGVVPATISITASDVDDLGAYANGVGRSVVAM